MKKLKIGVFGVGRGTALAKNFMLLGCDIVAICDDRPDRIDDWVRSTLPEAVVYDNFDAFIEHDMDAVILANFFHQHAPYAIRLFEKGIHVFSECTACGTMGEGVALVRAYEKSSSIYMLAENYPQMLFNREMKRICDEGSLGKILYAEGEYNHPANPKDTTFRKQFNYFAGHWRNYLPRTYYITHSLGPIMRATGATPCRVTAFGAFAPWGECDPLATHVGDRAAIITTQNDDGSIFRVTGCAAFGAHHNTYRICGTNGQIENLRGMGDKVMLRYNDWQIPEGREEINCYIPDWNDKDEEIIKTSGHGGSDYLTARMFVECVREGKQPDHPFDLYSAVTMSSVAILAHRSLLEGGVPYDIPDFRKAEDAAAYENDFLTPFPDAVREGDEKLPACSHPDYAPTEKQLALYEETLK